MSEIETEGKNKQEIVMEAIQEGSVTKDDLLDLGWPGVDKKAASASLASVFTGMRMAAKFAKNVPLCPVTDDNGIFSLVTYDEWQEMQTERAPKKVLTPEEALEAAQKRLDRATKAVATAEARNDKDPNRENELLFKRAEIEVELAEIALEKAQEAMG
ncbi:MAG: hypothetical protein M0Q54_09040 [Pigmentiphaga sp.]|nr:hypothetical protein [Pigmentiphaga sp.]